jgi:hypothetical protein
MLKDYSVSEKKSSNSFNFKFSIEVHKDDIEVLKYIQSVLGFGTVKSTRTNAVIYNVISRELAPKKNFYFFFIRAYGNSLLIF